MTTVPPSARSGKRQREDTLIFHSASLPQYIVDDVAVLNNDQMDVEGANVTNENVGQCKATKNYKYSLFVLYYQPKSIKMKDGAPASRKYVIRKKKFIIGNQGIVDLSSPDSAVNPLIVKSVRTRVGQWLVGHEKFDKKFVSKKGGFMNKQFWQNNLMWGVGEDLDQNFINVVHQLRKEMPVVKQSSTVKGSAEEGAAPKSSESLRYRFKKKTVDAPETQTVVS